MIRLRPDWSFRQPVSQLILMLVLGGVLLVLLLLALLRGAPRQGTPPASYGRFVQVVPLPGLSFATPERLFDPADYHALQRAGVSRPATEAVRQERRRLALLWLRLLREDVRTLWRFRRMLAVHGVAAGPADELRMAISGLAAVTGISLLRLAVAVAGPFSVAQSIQLCRARVESIWSASATLFGRMPTGQAAAFEQQWSAATAGAPVEFLH